MVMKMSILKNLKKYGRERATTLLELSLALTLSVIMVGTAAYYYGGAVEKSKESALKQTLSETRKAIDSYYKNKGKYPEKLEDLVNGDFAYLRTYPADPVTGGNVWLIIKENGHTAVTSTEYTGPVYDVRSSNPKYYNF
ncbi:MAG: hypothetical protein A2008_02220 [Candidatus Wallbacteria bacterium GWC2_49_35]|uniref:Type II secretion system protein GspG C-terminal domain-containing protein n=1 Tax=Candidatus Wallbacteria bacterium GWC2_49_35 TaxID=1817813 RepID=A0A1F7WT67_9BACT|nr:MAG: hypothetical protein A2008_02220 [Candidatus Wallbacteria bacterium GWC2_49_35]HBC76481.1 type II secretion system protein G [Candidatus Wallbacteria bacterium]